MIFSKLPACLVRLSLTCAGMPRVCLRDRQWGKSVVKLSQSLLAGAENNTCSKREWGTAVPGTHERHQTNQLEINFSTLESPREWGLQDYRADLCGPPAPAWAPVDICDLQEEAAHTIAIIISRTTNTQHSVSQTTDRWCNAVRVLEKMSYMS